MTRRSLCRNCCRTRRRSALDVGKFRACFESGKYANPVRDNVARMEALGVDSTPTFLVGLTPAPGQPMKVVKVIKGALPFADSRRQSTSCSSSTNTTELRKEPQPFSARQERRRVICPSNVRPHRPGIAVPQSGQVPSGVSRYCRMK